MERTYSCIENTFLNVYNREYRQQTPLFEVAKELLGAPMVEQTIEFADTDIPEAPVEALENENGQKEDPAEEEPLILNDEALVLNNKEEQKVVS